MGGDRSATGTLRDPGSWGGGSGGRLERMVDEVIEAYKKDVDRTLLRENLKLTPEQRLEKLAELQRLAIELRRAGESKRRG